MSEPVAAEILDIQMNAAIWQYEEMMGYEYKLKRFEYLKKETEK